MWLVSYAIADFFFFNDTATTEIYTLSLHDALPISDLSPMRPRAVAASRCTCGSDDRSSCRSADAASTSRCNPAECADRKSTRLNSSHLGISYAVFCLKKKKTRVSDREHADALYVKN